MDRLVSVRQSRTSGCVGDRPATPFGEDGESPSFILCLTNAHIIAVCKFVEEHGFWAHLSDHSVDYHATWSLNLSTIEELTLSCSCGSTTTFNHIGEEVKYA